MKSTFSPCATAKLKDLILTQNMDDAYLDIRHKDIMNSENKPKTFKVALTATSNQGEVVIGFEDLDEAQDAALQILKYVQSYRREAKNHRG